MDEKVLLESGYRKYTGEGIHVYFRRESCQHAGKCISGDRLLLRWDESLGLNYLLVLLKK